MRVVSDDRAEDNGLWRLYQAHVEEYRFQVQLNNQRYQWYVTLDVALLTVGTGLLRVGPGHEGRGLTALVFLTGLVLALLAWWAVALQVRYQHQARGQAEKVAGELDISDLAVGSTPGWWEPPGQRRRWRPRVRYLHYSLLAFLAAVQAGGFVYVLTR